MPLSILCRPAEGMGRMPMLLILLLGTTFSNAAGFPEPYDTEKTDSQPMPAEEAARTAVLPEGFRLEVFAAEPEVRQPIGIAFDGKGRLWVAECYTYAENPRRWDLDLRDRVIVLEDTDGDGKADKRTVFWDQGTRLTSVAVGHGGVWVTCAPQLLFIPDADGDLVPDGEPVVMLDGFDAETIGHNIVNGLKFGPDGWLYGRHGITSTSFVGAPGTPEDERVALNCAIWRFHPERNAFEVFCHGGTNPWGLDWNEDGQLFYTNTVIGHLWHAIPGAYYERMFGAHLNPYAYELIGHTADHYHWDRGSEKWSDIREGISDKTSELGGGHAHMGCIIYKGGVWPEKYHGKLF
ncbi:MAG TPA: cytochrome C, partial [Bacteroidia bacterium]|nr:cytochrome C [Bacteroidia bacterium]